MSTGFRAIRLLHYTLLTCLEATLVHLIGMLLSAPGGVPLLCWWVLVAVVAVAAMVTSRFEPLNHDVPHIRWRTGLVALAVIAWATAAHQDAFTPTGILRTLPRLLRIADDRFLAVYFGLAASMWAWWRGTSVVDQGHVEVTRALRRSIIILVGVLSVLGITGFDPISRSADGTPVIRVVVELAGSLLLSFVALSLTRIVEAAAHSTHGAEWRWFRSSLVSTSLIVLVGLLLIAFLADPAGMLLREVARWVIFAMVGLMAPLIVAILWLMELVRQLLPRSTPLDPVMATATPVPDEAAQPALPAIPNALLAIPTIILLLLPIVVLLLVILFARRRRSRADLVTDEQRESIFSWGAVRADLADLLRGLRRSAGDGGLRGALRRLLAQDPATRIRRRYVQLLLKGEAAGKQRRPPETPHEFAPALAQLPTDEPAVLALTDIYERARYAPATVDDAAAREADRVWETLNRADSARSRD